MPSRGRKPSGFHRFISSDDINQISIRIPNKFIRGHRKNILLNNVAIIVSDDKLWPLDWMVSGDGKVWLQKGWPEFAEHYSLKTGYLLLFNHHGKSVFHVRIFDESSCEINYSPLTFQEIQWPATEYDNDDVDDDSLQRLYKLTRVLRKSYLHHLPLNKTFCNAVGISGYGNLRLRNDEGKTWKVKVMKYKSKTIGKTILPHLVTGWPDFRKANEIKVGDISEISHVKGNLLHVHVVKKQNSK